MVKELTFKHALVNAILHDGKADAKAVVSKLIFEKPELKGKIKEIMPVVNETIQEVNRLSLEDQKKKLNEIAPEMLEALKVKVKKELKLPPLLGYTEKVIMRFAPNPSGPLHVGHARAAVLNDEYAKTYKGKLILRFEDTDPRRVDPDGYDAVREDLEWLNTKWHEEYIQSDRLEIYYEYARKMIEMDAAYVCTCSPDKVKELRILSQACDCRTAGNSIRKFERMLNGTYKQEEATVRIKTDMKHPNPAVRDWPALRIVEDPHPRVGKKYRVWPMMNFAVAIDDHLMDLTHVLRGKDHIVNTERQRFVFEYFGWKRPEYIHYGTLFTEEAVLKTSRIKEGIKKGVFIGWDDPRLGTLRALKRRGIQPEAVRRAMIEVGPKPVEVLFSWDSLYAHNKDLIDDKANRYFFVWDPIKLVIQNFPKPKFTSKIPIHPDHIERGYRTIEVKAINRQVGVYITKADAQTFNVGTFARLKDFCNFEVISINGEVKAKFHSEPFEIAYEKGAPIIHWIPKKDLEIDVIMPDCTRKIGFGEPDCTKLEVGQIVQFERFAFVRVDQKNGKIVAFYAHR